MLDLYNLTESRYDILRHSLDDMVGFLRLPFLVKIARFEECLSPGPDAECNDAEHIEVERCLCHSNAVSGINRPCGLEGIAPALEWLH